MCTFFFLCKDNFLYRNFYTNRKKEIFLTAGACVNNSFLYVFCSSIYAYILLNLNTVFYVHVTMTFSKQFQHFFQTYRIFLTNLMLYVYYILIAKVCIVFTIKGNICKYVSKSQIVFHCRNNMEAEFVLISEMNVYRNFVSTWSCLYNILVNTIYKSNL